MADYGRSISLSRDFSPTSDDDVSSDQSPRPPFSSPSPSLKLEQQTLTNNPMQQSTTQRKPRGRPRGSKNKPKPPVFIAKETHDSMKPVVLEISPGSDVIESIVNFANSVKSGISVVSASGSVSNVSLCHPCMSLNGPFNLLSLHGYVLSSGTTKPGSGFGICLAGAQGHVFGGIVGGNVIAATTVVVVAATFLNPAFHKLPGDESNEAETKQANVGNGQEVSTSSSVNTGMSVSVYGGVANPSPITTHLPPHQIMNWVPPSRPSYN